VESELRLIVQSVVSEYDTASWCEDLRASESDGAIGQCDGGRTSKRD
jgi:hypothetical protein